MVLIYWFAKTVVRMNKEELLKIKEDIKNILLKNGTRCLCGRSEWCSGCSPSSQENVTFEEVMEYFDRLENSHDEN